VSEVEIDHFLHNHISCLDRLTKQIERQDRQEGNDFTNERTDHDHISEQTRDVNAQGHVGDDFLDNVSLLIDISLNINIFKKLN
jgi:hypothetical protein